MTEPRQSIIFRGCQIRSLLVSFLERIRFGFWFLPALMAIASIALSLVARYIDRELLPADAAGTLSSWLYSGSAQGASSVLTTIASSMITIAGVVFSMTLVALTLASSQFGPRMLRNFMGDRFNQFVLGAFVATFLYCLLVLRSVHPGSEQQQVPHFSVTLAVILAIFDVGVLIHFIHHVSSSIQGDTIVARIGRELISAVERLVPMDRDESQDSKLQFQVEEEDAKLQDVSAGTDGYVQYIDTDTLVTLAAEHDLQIRMKVRPGQFRSSGSCLAVLDTDEEVSDDFRKRLRSAVAIGFQPISTQDLEFCMRQLVEIALRALSPGINEPFTAIQCLDRLGAALCLLDDRELPEWLHYSEDGKLRLLIPGTHYADLCSLAFDQIRQNLRGSVAVSLHMLDIMAMVLEVTKQRERRKLLLGHAGLVRDDALQQIKLQADREVIEERFSKLPAE